MKALITGASSGLGEKFAKILSEKGYDLILVARNGEKLKNIAENLNTKVKYYEMDLSIEKNLYKIYEKEKDIDVLINNAGFGVFGKFTETDLDKELNLINTNLKAVHILTKLYLKEFKKKNNGYILNVSSSAAFMPGPLLSSYYASKSYVYNLTLAIYEELKRENSNVSVSVLCPGPVDTNFNNVAGVRFGIKALKSSYVTNYAIRKMFKRKLVIIPGIKMKLTRFVIRFIPTKLLLKITYKIQKSKLK